MEKLSLKNTSILLVFSLSHLLLCASNDRITPGAFISSDETLVSDGGSFVLGFFSPKNSSSDLYLGVWYNIPQKTVVWVANREKPIKDSSVGLLISNDSNLVVMDSAGGIYWSSNLTGLGTPGNRTEMVLLNTGNLVLRENSNISWQSFDHPTDTFLPGMKIQYTYSNHSGQRITSWENANDPTPGNFSLGIDPITSLELMIWSGSKVHWRSQMSNGKSSFALRGLNSTSVLYLTVTADEDAAYIMFSVTSASPHMRFTLTPSGEFQLLDWDHSSKNWQKLFSLPSTSSCNIYGWCGQFAYCDVTESACKCLQGFMPRVQNEWNTGNFSGGCIRKKALQCRDRDGFLRVESMKLPDNFVVIRNTNINDCRSTCIVNCSCTAYAYNELYVGNKTKSRCFVWMGELIDAEKLNDSGDDLYLRLMDLNLGISGSKRKTRKIVIIVTLLASIFSFTCIFILWRFRDRMKGTFKGQNRGKLGYEEFVKTEPDQGPELPLINFESILLATEDFSDSNKLGRGGFGIVYKGKLPGGQEMAVKRLITGSGEGLEEFKNEVILIAKLQHKNLVRLLGCCIHGEERLLVYEYMPNKSLDFFLFDPVEKQKLDWGKRFNIIKGVARALLYLHEDSRLRIIHRDLKASNILLDKDMCPKISDFGIARIFEGNQDEANTKRIVGTYGYMSPEYAMEGLFSMKSDVYSFGVLLLEIVTGLRNSGFQFIQQHLHLLPYAWKLWNEGNAMDCIDPSIAESCSPDEVLRSIHVGLLCVQDSPNDRPTMSSIFFMLENEAVISQTPKQPIFTIQRNLNPDNLEISLNKMTITAVEGR